MYQVIKCFVDLQDSNYRYNVGAIFPREGLDVTETRLEELSGSQNRQGVPLIQLVEQENDSEQKQDEPTKETPKTEQATQRRKSSAKK